MSLKLLVILRIAVPALCCNNPLHTTFSMQQDNTTIEFKTSYCSNNSFTSQVSYDSEYFSIDCKLNVTNTFNIECDIFNIEYDMADVYEYHHVIVKGNSSEGTFY